MKKILTLTTACALTACAGNPDKMDAAYVSALNYQDFTCEQISAEMTAISDRSIELYNELKSERKADNWQMGVGVVLFFPTLFFLEGGDGPEANEFTRLKGEFQALNENNEAKGCDIQVASLEDQIKEARAEEKRKKKEAKKKKRKA